MTPLGLLRSILLSGAARAVNDAAATHNVAIHRISPPRIFILQIIMSPRLIFCLLLVTGLFLHLPQEDFRFREHFRIALVAADALEILPGFVPLLETGRAFPRFEQRGVTREGEAALEISQGLPWVGPRLQA